MTTLHNTIEQGKRLKELGVYNARHHYRNPPYEQPDEIIRITIDEALFPYRDMTLLPALTLGELFAVIDWDKVAMSGPYMEENCWLYTTPETDFIGTIPTHLAADVLIYLLEQGIVTSEAVNEKLKNLK